MYKLMIVDDELVIRDGLKKNIPWGDLQVELVCEAGDGIEAMALYEEYKPNIVLMDINLPFNNGLDVAHEILTADPDAKIIIITGHNDFEYAQKALKIGAFDLLSKPMDPSGICNTIRKACEALDTIRNQKLKSQDIQRLLEDSMPLLREKYVVSLLNSNFFAGEEQIMEKLKTLGIDMENWSYNIAVLIPEMPDRRKAEEELLLVAAKDIVEEHLLKNNIKTFLYSDNLYRMVLLFSYSEDGSNDSFDSLFINIKDKIRFYLNIDVFIGIGKETQSLDMLSYCYKSACEALNYVNIYGRNNVVNIKNVNTIERNKSIYGGKDIDMIITSFKTGNYEEFSDKLNSLVNIIIAASLGNLETVKRMFIELMAAILRACDELDIPFEHLFEAEGPYAKILSFSNMLDLKSWILGICKDMINKAVEKRCKKVNRLIELAKKYINENYKNEDLNLKAVCEHVGLSNTYFCQLFYQETQLHFSDYINLVRIEAAKKQLEDSIMKIYEIAYAVGYNNPKYFNMIFKKVTGKTPVEFRNSCAIGR
jgi:Response regulator containing CheY-like receiver domain and AraC-type DNA-binding domain